MLGSLVSGSFRIELRRQGLQLGGLRVESTRSSNMINQHWSNLGAADSPFAWTYDIRGDGAGAMLAQLCNLRLQANNLRLVRRVDRLVTRD